MGGGEYNAAADPCGAVWIVGEVSALQIVKVVGIDSLDLDFSIGTYTNIISYHEVSESLTIDEFDAF